jgi:hypothetical protein
LNELEPTAAERILRSSLFPSAVLGPVDRRQWDSPILSLKIATEAPAARVARRSFRKTRGNLRHKSPAVPPESPPQISTLPDQIPN